MASDILNETVKNVLSSMNKNIERLEERTALMTRHIVDLMDRIEQLEANNKELKEIVAKVTKNPEEEEKQKIRQANLAFIKSQWYINPKIYYKMKIGVDFGDVDVLKNIVARFPGGRPYMKDFLGDGYGKKITKSVIDLIDSIGFNINKKWGKHEDHSMLRFFTNSEWFCVNVNDDEFQSIITRLKKYSPELNKPLYNGGYKLMTLGQRVQLSINSNMGLSRKNPDSVIKYHEQRIRRAKIVKKILMS